MSETTESGGRSLRRIRRADLQRLGRIARLDSADFFRRYPRYSALPERVVAIALCQGAAQHYVDGSKVIKDFDVWTFYDATRGVSYPWRRPPSARDFGLPRFGRTEDYEYFVGRRVDCLGRSLRIGRNVDPVSALVSYVRAGRGRSSAAKLAEQAVVLIEPVHLLGAVVWTSESRGAATPDR